MKAGRGRLPEGREPQPSGRRSETENAIHNMAVDKERMAKLSRDPRLVEALKAMGGFLWYYTELYPYRTIYTLTVCRDALCVYIAGEDMMDMRIQLEKYLELEDDEERLRQLARSLDMLAAFSEKAYWDYAR